MTVVECTIFFFLSAFRDTQASRLRWGRYACHNSDMNEREHTKPKVERITAWIGSIPSLVLHTIAFLLCFVAGAFGLVSWTFMLLVLTTAVSLEAIYLAIFIQMTVNRHTEHLVEVSEDVEDIQEDIQELGEDVEDIQEDVQEITEDISEEEHKETERKHKQLKALDQLTKDVQRVLLDLEALKKR